LRWFVHFLETQAETVLSAADADHHILAQIGVDDDAAGLRDLGLRLRLELSVESVRLTLEL
jgi:hypothetical protein